MEFAIPSALLPRKEEEVLREPGRLKKWTEGGGEDCSSVWR